MQQSESEGGEGGLLLLIINRLVQSATNKSEGGRGVFYFLSSPGRRCLCPKIHLTECSTCEVCLAALPFPSWEEESGWLGGHEVKEQFVRGAAGELTSSVWRGSEATEERGFVCVGERERLQVGQ